MFLGAAVLTVLGITGAVDGFGAENSVSWLEASSLGLGLAVFTTWISRHIIAYSI